jgi:ribosomal protein S21
MRVHGLGLIGAALRRFKKLLERSGLTKELRKGKVRARTGSAH